MSMGPKTKRGATPWACTKWIYTASSIANYLDEWKFNISTYHIRDVPLNLNTSILTFTTLFKARQEKRSWSDCIGCKMRVEKKLWCVV